MADSIPSLRRKNQELRNEIADLRRQLAEKPEPVERMVEVVKEVEVPVAMYPATVQRVDVERKVYVTDPSQEETIRALQAIVCQFTSQ